VVESKNKDEGLGPGTYQIKMADNSQKFSFGSRFNSSIRSKNHLRPEKVDGPGPGAYRMPNSVKIQKRHPLSVNRTTFGTAGRQFVNLPKDTPAPNHYRPIHFTEASHAYSISRPPEIEPRDALLAKQRLPGPGSYNVTKEMKDDMKYAKSMLGGSLKEKELVDNGVPGPDAYQIGPTHKIPGFVIVQETSKSRKQEDLSKIPVGPQRYDPQNPALKQTSHN
jgi:hypothetical protein